MRTELPTVPLCAGCGRCCDTIGLPPFEVANPDLGAVPVVAGNDSRTDQRLRDMDTFFAMPADLRAEHAALVTELDADPFGKPCAWFDAESKACRHYEHRPAVCRDFEPGEPRCLKLRAGAKVEWRGATRPDDWWNPRHPDPDPPESGRPWDREPNRLLTWLGGVIRRLLP